MHVQCCEVYEMCVSCCLSADNKDLREEAMKLDKDKLTVKPACTHTLEHDTCVCVCLCVCVSICLGRPQRRIRASLICV